MTFLLFARNSNYTAANENRCQVAHSLLRDLKLVFLLYVSHLRLAVCLRSSARYEYQTQFKAVDKKNPDEIERN